MAKNLKLELVVLLQNVNGMIAAMGTITTSGFIV